MVQLLALVVSRFGITFFYVMLSLYVSEMYPTTVRGIGFAMMTLVSAISELGFQWGVREL